MLILLLEREVEMLKQCMCFLGMCSQSGRCMECSNAVANLLDFFLKHSFKSFTAFTSTDLSRAKLEQPDVVAKDAMNLSQQGSPNALVRIRPLHYLYNLLPTFIKSYDMTLSSTIFTTMTFLQIPMKFQTSPRVSASTYQSHLRWG